MAIIVNDRVRELTSTTGTGSVTLSGAPSGFQTFDAGVGVGNQTYYTIADAATGAWEVGIGTLSGSTTLARTQVLQSSNADALVNFGSGTKDVFVSYPADMSVSQADVGTAPNQIPLNQYLGSLAYVNSLTTKVLPGAGVTLGVGTICTGEFANEASVKTIKILIDLTGLKGGGTAGDLIGSDSTAINSTKQPCYIAQIPTGFTVLGGRMTCLEAPAGGGTDIDLYAATEGTGVQDSAVGDLTETEVINAGVQSLGTLTYFAADPASLSYLYLVSQGTSTTAYTAGRFLIEIFGV